MEDRTAEGRGTMVLEGQVFFSYSRHNVNVPVTGGWACLGLLQSSRQAHPALFSLGLIFVHFTLGPKLPTPAPLTPPPEAWQRSGAGCLSISPSVLAVSAPAPALCPLHLITCLLCLLDDFLSCSQMQFQVN